MRATHPVIPTLGFWAEVWFGMKSAGFEVRFEGLQERLFSGCRGESAYDFSENATQYRAIRAARPGGLAGQPKRASLFAARPWPGDATRSTAAACRRSPGCGRCRTFYGSRASRLPFSWIPVCRRHVGICGGSRARDSSRTHRLERAVPGWGPDRRGSRIFCRCAKYGHPPRPPFVRGGVRRRICRYSANGIAKQPLFDARAAGTGATAAASDNSKGLSHSARESEFAASTPDFLSTT